MPAELSPIDKAKFVAAKRAVDFVEDGMKLGLGTGSTAAWMVRCLAERIRNDGLRVVGVPTSTRTAELARQLGVPVTSLDDAKWLDLTIDGADEFDPNLALIKGGGAALLREKPVHAYRFQGTRFDCGTHIGLIEATIRYALDHEALSDAARSMMQSALNELGVRELG